MSNIASGSDQAPKKIHSKNEFELCYLRHQYVRRITKNPTEAEMAPYYAITRHFARRTFYTYFGLFQLVGFTDEDVLNTAKVHLVSYLGVFSLEADGSKMDKFLDIFYRKNKRAPGDTDLLNKNKANYTSFLKQRMEDLVRVCRQKARNIKGMQTDDFLVFSGAAVPPDDLTNITTTYLDYGYRKIDASIFRTVKKKIKDQTGPIFTHNGLNYIVVEVDHRNLDLVDLIGADISPYESAHNKDPEQIMVEAEFETRTKQFFKSSVKTRRKKLRKFISLHHSDPSYNEEIETARKMLRKL